MPEAYQGSTDSFCHLDPKEHIKRLLTINADNEPRNLARKLCRRSQGGARIEQKCRFGAAVEDEMKTTKAGIEIWDLDGNGIRYAVARDGLVRYVGTREQCLQRAEILAEPTDRQRQDQMLARAVISYS